MKHLNGLSLSCGAIALTLAASTSLGATPSTATPGAKPSQPPSSAHHIAVMAAERAKAKLAAQQASVLLLAPADEYFGPLKVSIIGIRNTIRDMGLRYDVNHDVGPQTYASAQLTERAIRDWEKKYPHDDQLPRAIYFLQRLYVKILTEPSREHATAVADWMFKDFGNSPQAKELRKTIAAEHLDPIPDGSAVAAADTAAAAAVAPAGAAATTTASASGGTAAVASPAAKATPTAAIATQPVPTPRASPSAAIARAGSDRAPATPASVAVAPHASTTDAAAPAPAGTTAGMASDATTLGAMFGSSFGAAYPSVFAPQAAPAK